MSRYIDAEKIEFQYLPLAILPDMFATRLQINNIPTADVAPVVHAHWIDKEEAYGSLVYEFRVCSNCYTKYDTVVMATCCAFIPSDTDEAKDGKFPKCPVCGAKMDKEMDKQ